MTINLTSCVIFWIEDGHAKHEQSELAIIAPALKRCEELRNRAKAGEAIEHVCMSTKSIDNVTLPGVSDKRPADYDWMMRRKPFVPGRPSGNI